MGTVAREVDVTTGGASVGLPDLSANDLTTRGTVVLGTAAMAVVTVLDLLDGNLGLPFSVGFVLIVVTLPLAISVHELFAAGVAPPLLLLGTLLVVTIVAPDAVAVDSLAAEAGTFTRYLASVLDHAITLVVGHAIALGLIVTRIVSDV